MRRQLNSTGRAGERPIVDLLMTGSRERRKERARWCGLCERDAGEGTGRRDWNQLITDRLPASRQTATMRRWSARRHRSRRRRPPGRATRRHLHARTAKARTAGRVRRAALNDVVPEGLLTLAPAVVTGRVPGAFAVPGTRSEPLPARPRTRRLTARRGCAGTARAGRREPSPCAPSPRGTRACCRSRSAGLRSGTRTPARRRAAPQSRR